MSILANDVKLIASRVMDDVSEGGGGPTATVIVDGASNAIFQDISELDRAGGDVSLRQIFIHVDTDNRDTYLGSNVIVAVPPVDPNVSVTLFTTRETFDQRASAASRIESYLGAASELAPYLLENHIIGQRSVQLFGRVGVDLPQPGDTIVLAWRVGFSDEKKQYVRVTRTTVDIRTFTAIIDGRTTDYDATVATCDISDPLRFDFTGSPPNRLFVKAVGATGTLGTTVTDAATYYGCVALAAAAGIGDRVVAADSIYTQLVPSSQTESPVLDQNPAASSSITLATSPRLITVAQAGHSQRIKVKSANRALNFVSILTPLPAPGTVRASYRALGKWYDIIDNGDGTLGGSGAGIVTYTTGSIQITLQALPDVGSSVIFQWGEKTSYTDRSGSIAFRAPEFSFGLDHTGIVPGSVTIAWTSGGDPKTATVNAAGVISGDATGNIQHVTGTVTITPVDIPDPGVEFVFNYDYQTLVQESKTGSDIIVDSGGSVSFSLDNEPVPGTVQVNWSIHRSVTNNDGSNFTGGVTSKSDFTQPQSTMTTYTTVPNPVPPPLTPVTTAGGADAGGSLYMANYLVSKTVVTPSVRKDNSTGSTRTTKIGRAHV